LAQKKIYIAFLQPVEKDASNMTLQLNMEPTALGKLRFLLFVEASLSTMHELGFTDYDTDDVKGIFYDTSLYLLLLTVFVSSFHVIKLYLHFTLKHSLIVTFNYSYFLIF